MRIQTLAVLVLLVGCTSAPVLKFPTGENRQPFKAAAATQAAAVASAPPHSTATPTR